MPGSRQPPSQRQPERSNCHERQPGEAALDRRLALGGTTAGTDRFAALVSAARGERPAAHAASDAWPAPGRLDPHRDGLCSRGRRRGGRVRLRACDRCTDLRRIDRHERHIRGCRGGIGRRQWLLGRRLGDDGRDGCVRHDLGSGLTIVRGRDLHLWRGLLGCPRGVGSSHPQYERPRPGTRFRHGCKQRQQDADQHVGHEAGVARPQRRVCHHAFDPRLVGWLSRHGDPAGGLFRSGKAYPRDWPPLPRRPRSPWTTRWSIDIPGGTAEGRKHGRLKPVPILFGTALAATRAWRLAPRINLPNRHGVAHAPSPDVRYGLRLSRWRRRPGVGASLRSPGKARLMNRPSLTRR